MSGGSPSAHSSAKAIDGVVVYSGRPALHFLDDHGPPFKANPHFLHWAPLLDAPDCFVRYLPGERPELVFHQPADYWHKPPEVPDRRLDARVRHQGHPRTGEARALLDAGNRRLAFVGECQPPNSATGASARSNPAGLLAYLHYHRAAKTPYELACMREASRLGARGHVAAAAAFHAGASEFEVHQAYCSAIGLREQELPYGNIIAFGEGAAILHYTTLGRRRDVPRPSFLIDAGAQCRGYASDITRTHAAPSRRRIRSSSNCWPAWTPCSSELCAAVRPGVDYRDIHLLAHRLIARPLCRAGIIVGCDAETPLRAGCRACSFRTASATCSACRCTTWPGSPRTKRDATRSRARPGIRTCG